MQVSADNIINAVVIITLIFLIAAFFVVTYVRIYNERKRKSAAEKITMQAEFEKQLLRSQIEVQETTISALGRELHDNIGQLLSTTKMLLAITERAMPTVPDTFNTAQATLGKAILEIRSLSKSLDKEWLEQFNFIDNIRTEINRINASQELTVHFYHSEVLSLTAEQQIILFRIVQEAVQNSIKHAEAKELRIGMEEGESLKITIQDNGRGMPDNLNSSGMGLFNMRQRAMLLGGTISWQSQTGEGTSVVIELPLIQQE